MANNEELSPETNIHSHKVKLDVQETMLNMELICNHSYVDQDMIDTKEFRENFNLPEFVESPDAKNSSASCNKSYISEYSVPLSSTLRSEDDEWKKMDVSPHSSNSSGDSDPSTSTPQRKINSTLRKYKVNRPPDLIIAEASDEDDYNNVNVDVNQCSPVRSPFPGLDDTLDLDNSCIDLDDTIEPPHYDTPPTGIEFDKRAKKMVYLLKRYGLTHLAFIFIEQEVDMDLFLTLTDSDLEEIGIERKRDRNMLLSMIEECNRRN